MADTAERGGREVGDQIRQARRAAGLSLTQLAALAGIGKGSLSELEAGQRNPTLSTLYAVANALGVPLARLLGGSPGAQLSSPGITARLLDTLHRDSAVVEVYVLELAGGTHASGAHGAGVTEHLFLVEGAAALGPADAPVEITAGSSATFRGDVPHIYASLTERATGILTITTPGGR